jgi:hypothetical protein
VTRSTVFAATACAAILVVAEGGAADMGQAFEVTVRLSPPEAAVKRGSVPPEARGRLVVRAPGKTLFLRFFYSHLSSPVTAVDLQLAEHPGFVYPESVMLCAGNPPCPSGRRGAMTNPAFVSTLRRYGGVVVVDTVRNPDGELVGRLAPRRTRTTASVSSSESSRTPVSVVLASPGGSLPAPGHPHAHAELTISQPRSRNDGYLASVVRIRGLELPEHRSYFLRADFGAYHKYLCEGLACEGRVVWIFSRRKLNALRTFGAYIEMFIHAPSGFIWSVATGRMPAGAFALPRGAQSTPGLSATLSPNSVLPASANTQAQARGRFSGTLNVGEPSNCVLGCRATYALSWSKLSGPPTDIAIRFGARSETGNVWRWLCGRHDRTRNCPRRRNGLLRGSFPVWNPQRFPPASYVEISTALNPAGELRGQIRLR